MTSSRKEPIAPTIDSPTANFFPLAAIDHAIPFPHRKYVTEVLQASETITIVGAQVGQLPMRRAPGLVIATFPRPAYAAHLRTRLAPLIRRTFDRSTTEPPLIRLL